MVFRIFLVFWATFLFLIAGGSDAASDASVLRVVEQGVVRGIQWDGDTIAWLGVPYARPPEGTLRWKAPRPAKPFFGVHQADQFASECTQIGGLLLDLEAETFGTPMGSEDCLYLNVWRPKKVAPNLPVFVWIHGGMNSVGEGATSLYHGARLAHAANAIVVTINYRLGLLGWFAHESLQTGDPKDDSGNYGLLDIIAALEWIQQNIASFGGNPRNVTLGGESGGAFNVISLLGSPLAKGLFHRAFAASPAASMMALNMTRAHKRGDDFSKKILVAKGLASNLEDATTLIGERGPQWIGKTLLALDTEEILANSTPISSLGFNEIGLVTDVLGASRFEDGLVIAKGFRRVMKQGGISNVPLMIGSNTEEFKIFQIAFGIIATIDEYALLELIQNFDPTLSQYQTKDFVSWYEVPEYQLLGARAGEALFRATGVDPVAKHLSRYGPVYVYKFSWNDQPEPFDFLVGASHMMELPFVFGNFQTDENALFRFAWGDHNRDSVQDMSKTIIGFLANFMRSGDPNQGPWPVPSWKSWSNFRPWSRRLHWDYTFRSGK